tara:strand:+ start:5994 stop:7175 length:1182 start_codon:yes stop_codon:yes gene_type:complete
MKNMTLALFALLLCALIPSHAQVGINTTSPNGLLDIEASSAVAPSNKDGILIPRVSTFPAVNPSFSQDGMLIFLSNAVGTNDKGFYYWDDTPKKWINIGAEEWKAGTNSSGDDLIYATRAKLTGTDMVITDDGRIGFGTSDPVERFEFRGPGDNDFQITSANTNPPNFILYNTGGTLDVPTALAADGEIGSFIVKTHDGTAIRENGGFRFYMDGVATPGSTPSKFIINTTPQGSVSQVQRLSVRSNGNVGFTEPNPTATIHVRAGSAAANSAPLKFTSGTNLSTPEAGAMEFDGSNLYFTPNASRQVLLKGYANTSSINFPGISSGSTVESTVTISGAKTSNSCNCSPDGSIEAGLIWSCYVSAANTVTVRMFNTTGSVINPAIKNWKITVID